MSNITNRDPLLNYVVVFHKVESLNKGLSQEACEKLCATFRFSKRGEEYFFDEKANPRYSNHVVRGALTLRNDQIMEVDNVDMDFTLDNKKYHTIAWLSCISYLNPFQVKGVFNTEYYRAAYSVFSDDLDEVEKALLQ